VHIGHEAEYIDEISRTEEDQASTVELPCTNSIGQNFSSQIPTPGPSSPLHYDYIPQDSAAVTMNPTEAEPGSSPPFITRMDIPTGPAAMQNKRDQKPIACKGFHHKDISRGTAATQNKLYPKSVLCKDFPRGSVAMHHKLPQRPVLDKDFPRGPAAMRHKLPPKPVLNKDFPRYSVAMQHKLPQKPVMRKDYLRDLVAMQHKLPKKPITCEDFSRAPADLKKSTKHAYGARRTFPSPPSSSPIGKRLSQCNAGLTNNSGLNSDGARNNSHISRTQYVVSNGLEVLRNSTNNGGSFNLRSSTIPKSIPKGPAAMKDVELVRLTGAVREEAVRVILQKKGARYVPSHGWDKDRLPKYSIPCFAINGLQALLGVGSLDNSHPAIRNAFPNFKIMFQKVKIGLSKYSFCSVRPIYVFAFS
jgi:hypothetical protein